MQDHGYGVWVAVVFVAIGCSGQDPSSPSTDDASVDAATASVGFESASEPCKLALVPVMAPGGSCVATRTACEGSAACLKYVTCIERCENQDCNLGCQEAADASTKSLGDKYLFCACCRSEAALTCAGSCNKFGAGFPNGEVTAVGPLGAGCVSMGFEQGGGPCNGCLETAFKRTDECAHEYENCVADVACIEYVGCVRQCGKSAGSYVDCVNTCAGTAGTATVSVGKQYLSCACSCGTCGTACAATCSVNKPLGITTCGS